MGRTRRPRAKTEGRWHPLRSSRATGRKITGYLELFWAPGHDVWVSLPDVSRLADATGRVLSEKEEFSVREVTPEAFLKLAEKCEKAAARGSGVPLLEDAQDGFEEAALIVRTLTEENRQLREVCEKARDVLNSLPPRAAL